MEAEKTKEIIKKREQKFGGYTKSKNQGQKEIRKTFKKPAEKPKHKIKETDKKLKIMALGGLGEVGKNCYLFEYDNDLFVIDYGVIFPDREQIGVDYIIPNFTYLKENEKRIKGLFITHGHEDHIGGIPFLLKKVKIENIYTPVTSKYMIERKLKEHKVSANLIEIDENTELTFGKVKLYTYHQTHSTPDSLGFFFETPDGNVATTGDFKVDFSPPGEEKADFHKMVDLSRKKVLCLMSDSTNSQREGFSVSAESIGNNLKLLMRETEGRILYTTFASHINRVEKIVEGALENNRKICVLGRSMKTNLAIGIKTGYIKLRKSDIIDPKEIKNYPPEKICILSTGSQGEMLAALSRIAHGLNPHIELSEDDTVVFASNPIPGNNYQIGKVIDQLYKTGCKVISNTSYFPTHTSGHASKEEQKLILSLFKPQYFVPIHGTYSMTLEHKKTAERIGIPSENIFLLNNGDMITLSNKHYPEVIRKKTVGKSILVSGNNINIEVEKSNITQLASSGILIISIVSDQKNQLLSYPQLTTRGFIIINESIELLKKIQQLFVKIYKQNYKLKRELLVKKCQEELSKFIFENCKKKPDIRINIIDISEK